MNLCPRGSVGAVIRRGNEILMLERLSYPPGWALPAGHMEIDGKTGSRERPEDALGRELEEEIGIRPVSWQLIFQGIIPNPCRHGFDAHEWWVYEITAWLGEPRLMEPTKHRVVEWKKPDFLASLADELYDPAWRMLIDKLRQLKPTLLA